MLKFDEFKPVSLSDREILISHYAKFPQVHSDNTFTNIVCWNHYAHYQYVYRNDNILLLSQFGEKIRYRPPIGPQNPDLLHDLIALAIKSSDNFPLVILDPETRDWISGLYPELNFYPERKYFDYVYRATDLANLPGKKYLTIRHQLNQFLRNCSPKVEQITKNNIGEINDFLEQWCEWKDCDAEPILIHEKEAVFYAMSHFIELKLSGLAIREKGTIKAMAIFEKLNKDTAVVHFEKGLPECKGIYREINAETAKFLAKDYTYINRESDMGVEGIREAKLRYHPDHMVEVNLIKRDELEKVV